MSLGHCQVNTLKADYYLSLKNLWAPVFIYDDFTIWRCIVVFNSFLLPLLQSSPSAYQLSLCALRKNKTNISHSLLYLSTTQSPDVPFLCSLFLLPLVIASRRLSYSSHLLSLLNLPSHYQTILIKIQNGSYLPHLNKSNNKWQIINRSSESLPWSYIPLLPLYYFSAFISGQTSRNSSLYKNISNSLLPFTPNLVKLWLLPWPPLKRLLSKPSDLHEIGYKDHSTLVDSLRDTQHVWLFFSL